ncbi:hypothetical protein H4219_001287 [Mycoemilia scoparia]|uniref:Uncharacterized protein n=1 Tax=Mycoemilia scoparia TaxID=417184 RepID=A0A9W8A0I8_9FUNG|nr:hypothetical protein H4219_001287 [Mycoemilia scoparia]
MDNDDDGDDDTSVSSSPLPNSKQQKGGSLPWNDAHFNEQHGDPIYMFDTSVSSRPLPHLMQQKGGSLPWNDAHFNEQYSGLVHMLDTFEHSMLEQRIPEKDWDLRMSFHIPEEYRDIFKSVAMDECLTSWDIKKLAFFKNVEGTQDVYDGLYLKTFLRQPLLYKVSKCQIKKLQTIFETVDWLSEAKKIEILLDFIDPKWKEDIESIITTSNNGGGITSLDKVFEVAIEIADDYEFEDYSVLSKKTLQVYHHESIDFNQEIYNILGEEYDPQHFENVQLIPNAVSDPYEFIENSRGKKASFIVLDTIVNNCWVVVLTNRINQEIRVLKYSISHTQYLYSAKAHRIKIPSLYSVVSPEEKDIKGFVKELKFPTNMDIDVFVYYDKKEIPEGIGAHMTENLGQQSLRAYNERFYSGAVDGFDINPLVVPMDDVSKIDDYISDFVRYNYTKPYFFVAKKDGQWLCVFVGLDRFKAAGHYYYLDDEDDNDEVDSEGKDSGYVRETYIYKCKIEDVSSMQWLYYEIDVLSYRDLKMLEGPSPELYKG